MPAARVVRPVPSLRSAPGKASTDMDTLLDRFCRYVRVTTQSDETSKTYPSTPGQLDLGRMLAEELRALGLRDAAQDAHGIVMATVPATVPRKPPASAPSAH